MSCQMLIVLKMWMLIELLLMRNGMKHGKYGRSVWEISMTKKNFIF